MAEPAEVDVARLTIAIGRAWQDPANEERVYPPGAPFPDPIVLADIASRTAWAFFEDLAKLAELEANTIRVPPFPCPHCEQGVLIERARVDADGTWQIDVLKGNQDG